MIWEDGTEHGGSGEDDDIFYKKKANLPSSPTLDPIEPYFNEDGEVDLNWNETNGATRYYVFRDTSNISTLSTPELIAMTTETDYEDDLEDNDVYHYAIVASNSTGNSTFSNSEKVSVKIDDDDGDDEDEEEIPPTILSYEIIIILASIAIFSFLKVKSIKALKLKIKRDLFS